MLIVEQSLTEFLALSAHDARSSLVSRQLPRPRRSGRRRRLQPLHAGRARAVAARGGTDVPEFRRGQRYRGTRAHRRDRRTGRLRHRLSAARLGAGRKRAAVLRRRAGAAGLDPQFIHAADRDAAELARRAARRSNRAPLPPVQTGAPHSYPAAKLSGRRRLIRRRNPIPPQAYPPRSRRTDRRAAVARAAGNGR